MSIDKSWHFKCKLDKESGGYVLENSNGMLAGQVLVESTGSGTTLFVVNTRHEVTLVLETTNGRNQHAVVLAPRRAVADAKNGLAVYGVIDRKTSGFDHVYEYESSTGSEILRVIAEGFPRRLVISKDDVRVAEIEKNPREMTVHMSKQAKDTDVLLIIGIMLAVCLLILNQSNMPNDIEHPAIVIR
jgi:hypothetical protein